MRESSLGRNISRGYEFSTGGICKNSYVKFFFNCLTFSLPIRFWTWRCSGGNIRGYFLGVLISGKKKSREGDIFGAIDTDQGLKSFSNESIQRIIFQAESSARHFTGRGDFQRGWN